MRGIPRRKLNRPMRFAAALLLFVLLSVHSIAGLYASYASSSSGGDGARVARFDVTLICEEDAFHYSGQTWFEDTQTLEYFFSVAADSEVAMRYSVTVAFDEPLPAYISLGIDNSERVSGDGSKTEFTFDGFFYGIGEIPKEHTLYFQVDYTDVDADYSAFTNFPVTVRVTAEQAI